MPFFPKAQRDECSLETFSVHTHDVDANVPQNAIQPNQPAWKSPETFTLFFAPTVLLCVITLFVHITHKHFQNPVDTNHNNPKPLLNARKRSQNNFKSIRKFSFFVFESFYVGVKFFLQSRVERPFYGVSRVSDKSIHMNIWVLIHAVGVGISIKDFGISGCEKM